VFLTIFLFLIIIKELLNYLQVDKPRFEKWLAFPIKDKINLRQYVLSIKKTNNCLIIYTDKSVFKTKLAIIATGSVFRLQKQLGLCKHNKETTLGYGGLYKNYKLNPDKFYYFFDNKYLGYFWVFPRNKEIANIGFAALNINKDIKQVFNNLLKKYIPKAKPIFNYGGIINYSGPIKRTYTNRILVCGGAAGFVHAGTGEGIIYALTSGTIAGKIAQKALEKNNTSAKFLRFYEKKWKRLIGKELKFGLEFYQILRLTYKYSKYERLFTKPTQRDLINMVKYSKLPARANISINLLKVLGLLPKEITKRPTPKSIRMVYKLSKLFS